MDRAISIGVFDAMKQQLNYANIVWLVLVVATSLSYAIAESHSDHSLGSLWVGILFALATVKGWLVIDVFMGMRTAPVFWRSIILVWLFVVSALLSCIYALTT